MKTIALGLCLAIMATGCATTKKAVPADSPLICGSSAWINEKDYELPDLTSTDDKAYEAWLNLVLKKYPLLKSAYGSLRECVELRHPDSGP